MKRCSTSYVIRELQTETRYQDTLIRKAKIWNNNNTKCWQGCGATGTRLHCWCESRTVQLLWKTVGDGFFTTWYRSCAPWYSPKGSESLCSHKNPHTNIYSIFIHNCQNRKVSKMSFSRWHWVNNTAVHPDNGVWLSAKKK